MISVGPVPGVGRQKAVRFTFELTGHLCEAAQQSARDPAVASLRECLRFEPAGDGGGS